jgi:hypothetical protein
LTPSAIFSSLATGRDVDAQASVQRLSGQHAKVTNARTPVPPSSDLNPRNGRKAIDARREGCCAWTRAQNLARQVAATGIRTEITIFSSCFGLLGSRERIVRGDCPAGNYARRKGFLARPTRSRLARTPATPWIVKAREPIPGPSWKYQCHATRSVCGTSAARLSLSSAACYSS